MECLATLIVLLVMLVVVARATSDGGGRKSRRRSYQRLARRFSGTYKSGGLFGAPSVRFRYGETLTCSTESSSRGPSRGRCTEVQVRWSDARLRAEIRYDDAVPTANAREGMQPVRSGYPDFDRQFSIRGGDERNLRDFLSDGVRWQIQRLLNIGHKDLYILIHRGWIYIQKPRPLRRYEDLHEFVQFSLELYDQAMITQAVGIEFVQSSEAATLEHVICKVCGEEIDSDMVFCRRCKTPHHAECWHYAGVCSVYGCQEQAYLRPRTAVKVSDSEHPR